MIGIPSIITPDPIPQGDADILLGTSQWRDIEQAGGKWLLVDRASWGDPENVSLVWNGHGQRGDHMVPKVRGPRPYPRLAPWRHQTAAEWRDGPVVLCGQTESYAPVDLDTWYERAIYDYDCTHFRPHPAGRNPTRLPEHKTWEGVRMAVTLNSSVAIEALLLGIQTVVGDEGGMAWGWSNGWVFEREPFFEWLAWTQWSWREIEAGHPIRHLFDGYDTDSGIRATDAAIVGNGASGGR